MKTKLSANLPVSTLKAGVVEALNVIVKESQDDYKSLIEKDIAPFLSPDYIYSDQKQKGIRSLLKTFGFHPSGRSRPASEFLFKDLQNRGSFNFINNIVDINNHVSLCTNLPISVFDLDKTGPELQLRVGGDDESYVFNREGQNISLKKLLVVAKNNPSSNEAVGSPVKDSQATKVFEDTKNILFVVYTSANITTDDEMNEILNQIAALLKQEAEASEVSTQIIDA